VNVLARDGGLRLLGQPQDVARVARILEDLLADLRRGRSITTADVAGRLRGNANAGEATAVPPAAGPRRAVKPRSDGQRHYLEAMAASDVVLGIGPAGTGKTYLAVAAALEAVKRGEVRRIVLSRPAVEAGEKLGFLPGDFQAKVDPYLRPLHDALSDLLEPGMRARFLEGDVIEVCPLAYMRGRTLSNAYVILDEAQNTTVPQMMMFLTRLGESSRMVVNGDPTQIDLPKNVTSGLIDAVSRLAHIPGVAIVKLTSADVVRHQVVTRILDAYGKSKSGKR
jgi:phosphate starvation-inducible PhoH-like protein